MLFMLAGLCFGVTWLINWARTEFFGRTRRVEEVVTPPVELTSHSMPEHGWTSLDDRQLARFLDSYPR
jgi:hypothetical protein